MKITPALRERFCKDLQLPIKIFTDPYFMERLVLYDIHFGCWEKYIDFEKMLEDYANEQEYFEAYNSLKETAIQYLLNNPDFTFFSQTEDMSKFAIPNRSLPKNSIYKQTMIGKHFVSFDLCKGNFTALHHYNEKIFDGAHTYEEFLSKFTNNKHFIESDAFVFQGFHHQIMHRPESVFRKRRSSQTVLIGHHSKLEIKFTTNKAQIAEHLRIELQLFISIELVIHWRLDDQRTVSIYEQYLFHSISILLKASNKASFSSFVPMVIRKQSLHKATFVRLRTMMPSLTK